MKQTPIQELKELVKESQENARTKPAKRVLELLLKVLDIQEEAEMEFARECFEAGGKYGRDSYMAMNDGMPEQQPDFDKWIKQYSKQKK